MKFIFSMVAIATILFSCKKEASPITNDSDNDYAIEVNTILRRVTKATLNEGETLWSKGDTYSFFTSNDNSPIKMSIKKTDGNFTDSEIFNGIIKHAENNINLYATWPYQESIDNVDFSEGTLKYNLNTYQEQEFLSSGDINPSSILKYDTKIGLIPDFNKKTPMPVEMALKSVNTILDLKLTNNTNELLNITKVVLSTKEAEFYTSAKVSFSDVEDQKEANSKVDELSINIQQEGKDGLNLETKKSNIVRAMLIPFRSNSILYVDIYTDGKDSPSYTIESKLSGKEYKAAKSTDINIDINPKIVSDGDYIDEYGINQGSGIELHGIVWAPVNCGYHADNFKFGKLYQWGRKHGQFYYSAFNYSRYNDAGEDGYSDQAIIKNGPVDKPEPEFFYTASYEPYDWIDIPSDNLWMNTKTNTDPCPKGWRVPTLAEMSKLADGVKNFEKEAQEGWSFGEKSSLYLPAAGYRLYGGTAISRGKGDGYGYYWTCTPHNSTVNILIFSVDEDPLEPTILEKMNRAYGCTVRCVKE